jgi:hypothetical protein
MMAFVLDQEEHAQGCLGSIVVQIKRAEQFAMSENRTVASTVYAGLGGLYLGALTHAEPRNALRRVGGQSDWLISN